MRIVSLINLIAEAEQPMNILLADVPHFTIVAYNQAYQQATYTHHCNTVAEPLGRHLSPTGRVGVKGAAGCTLPRPGNRYGFYDRSVPLQHPCSSNLNLAECWWQLDIVPVQEAGGQAGYLLVTCYNITERMSRAK
ncbi:hypothetical protein [Mucilaginibacter gynuensis]|uniref:hypothetical protein n=1 Tax=Mucilaginibacter gynuensis TaxID=1302236 RepID=UPI0031EC40E5